MYSMPVMTNKVNDCKKNSNKYYFYNLKVNIYVFKAHLLVRKNFICMRYSRRIFKRGDDLKIIFDFYYSTSETSLLIHISCKFNKITFI